MEYATRRDELAFDNLNTVLSTREWRTDACFTAILWLRDGQSIDLDRIASSMRQPRFVLYLGRKSAPLGLPLNPQMIEADTFMDAFAKRIATDEEQWIWRQTASSSVASGMIACDGDAPGAPKEGQIQSRRDSISNRTRWQFSERIERVILRRKKEVLREIRMPYLSRVCLKQDASVGALAPLLLGQAHNPSKTGHPAHHLIWSLFADHADRRRDFLWREMRTGVFFCFPIDNP